MNRWSERICNAGQEVLIFPKWFRLLLQSLRYEPLVLTSSFGVWTSEVHSQLALAKILLSDMSSEQLGRIYENQFPGLVYQYSMALRMQIPLSFLTEVRREAISNLASYVANSSADAHVFAAQRARSITKAAQASV